MSNNEIQSWIKQAREAGQPDDQIRQQLKQAGWLEEQINEQLTLSRLEKTYMPKRKKPLFIMIIIIVFIVTYIITFIGEGYTDNGSTILPRSCIKESDCSDELSCIVPEKDVVKVPIKTKGVNLFPWELHLKEGAHGWCKRIMGGMVKNVIEDNRVTPGMAAGCYEPNCGRPIISKVAQISNLILYLITLSSFITFIYSLINFIILKKPINKQKKLLVYSAITTPVFIFSIFLMYYLIKIPPFFDQYM